MSEAAESAVVLNWWQTSLGAIGAILLFGTFIATVLATRAATKAANAAVDQVRVTDRTAKQQLRAYVAVHSEGGSFGFPPPDGGTYQARVPVINRGQTPAFNMRFVTKIAILPFPRPEISIFSEYNLVFDEQQTNSDRVWFPMEVGDITAISDEELTWKEYVRVLHSDTQKVYVFGIIEYEDVFGDTHFTRFFQWIVPRVDLSHSQPWDVEPNASVAGVRPPYDNDAN